MDEELLDRLLAAAPNWVAVQRRIGSEARLVASPFRASQALTRAYELGVEVKSNRVHVREKSDRPLLPYFCPQRHLNPDGTFCLGLNAGGQLEDQQTARAWWDKLLVFLTCQDTAFETRDWPKTVEISHGAAGITEVAAENIAESLGLLEEYQRAVYEDAGIVAEAVRRINKLTGRLRNARARCLCGYRNKKGRLKLRRECTADGDACLPVIEAKRRREEIEFWSHLKGKYKCCETMDDCPLREQSQ